VAQHHVGEDTEELEQLEEADLPLVLVLVRIRVGIRFG
jgi:hypothetical protein